MKTWDDVLLAARGDVWISEMPKHLTLNVTASLFQAAVTLVEMGQLTREQAMIQLALALAEMAQRQHEQFVDLRNSTPSAPIVLYGGERGGKSERLKR